MKRIAILLLLLLVCNSVASARITIMFSVEPPPEDALFSGDTDEGIFWQFGGKSEFIKNLDVSDLEIQYIVDMKNSLIVPYLNETIPEYVAPIVMADRDFNIGFNGLSQVGEGCTFFLIEKKNNQEIKVEPILENKTFTVDVVVPSDYYLLVDADVYVDGFATCLGGISGGGRNISLSIIFNRLPSSSDYLAKYSYLCGDDESCFRDDEGKEINVTQWLKQGCPEEVILNGEEACKDWLIIKQATDITTLESDKDNVDPVIENVINKQEEAAKKDDEILTLLATMQSGMDEETVALIAGIVILFLIAFGGYYMRQRQGVKLGRTFIAEHISKIKLPEIKLPKVFPKKKVYAPEKENKEEDWQPYIGAENEIEEPEPAEEEKQEPPIDPEPEPKEELVKWDDNFEDCFIDAEKEEDFIDSEDVDLGKEEEDKEEETKE